MLLGCPDSRAGSRFACTTGHGVAEGPGFAASPETIRFQTIRFLWGWLGVPAVPLRYGETGEVPE
jgi:hypothetical protein